MISRECQHRELTTVAGESFDVSTVLVFFVPEPALMATGDPTSPQFTQRTHENQRAGANSAIPAVSETTSKRASTAIPTWTSSGSQSTRSVMRRGPSSKSIRATT
jgi:hypothetical protein